MRKTIQSYINNKKDLDSERITRSIKDKIITNGLKYCLATGNWGTTRGLFIYLFF
jgi:DNA-directed RNA polymerase beta subunit